MPKNDGWNELQQYAQYLSRYPVIRDPKKVAGLFKRWKKHGDRQAYDQLVYSNTRLIIAIALKFRGCGVPLPDLVQEGFLGLMRALEDWDETRASLGTHASWWIWSAMLQLISGISMKRPYRLPSKIYQRVGLVARIIKDFSDQYDRWPNDQEVYERIHAVDGTKDETRDLKHMTLREIKLCRRLLVERYCSLDSPPLPINGEEGKERFLSDVVADTKVDVDQIVESRYDLKKIEAEIDKLEPRERVIIRSRFLEEITLAEIGKSYGVSCERIRQIEEQVVKKIGQKLGIRK